VTLSSLVNRYPGRIDVFTANAERRWPEYDRKSSLDTMRRLAGCNYGYRHVLAASLLHLPIARFFVRPNLDDAAESSLPPFCSEAVSMAERAGGVEVVPHLADHFTEPFPHFQTKQRPLPPRGLGGMRVNAAPGDRDQPPAAEQQQIAIGNSAANVRITAVVCVHGVSQISDFKFQISDLVLQEFRSAIRNAQ
jgi:hypothetical protein